MEAGGRREVGGYFSSLRQEADTEPQVRLSSTPFPQVYLQLQTFSSKAVPPRDSTTSPTIEAGLGTECSIP